MIDGAKINGFLNLGKFAYVKFLQASDNCAVGYTRHTKGMQAFGRHLRAIRLEKGLSQEQLAWKADIELSQISRIERGIINTSLSQLLVIAEALEISLKELCDFEIDQL